MSRYPDGFDSFAWQALDEALATMLELAAHAYGSDQLASILDPLVPMDRALVAALVERLSALEGEAVRTARPSQLRRARSGPDELVESAPGG